MLVNQGMVNLPIPIIVLVGIANFLGESNF